MDCSPSGSSVRGISQAIILEWVPISSSSGSPQPRDLTCISCTGHLGIPTSPVPFFRYSLSWLFVLLLKATTFIWKDSHLSTCQFYRTTNFKGRNGISLCMDFFFLGKGCLSDEVILRQIPERNKGNPGGWGMGGGHLNRGHSQCKGPLSRGRIEKQNLHHHNPIILSLFHALFFFKAFFCSWHHVYEFTCLLPTPQLDMSSRRTWTLLSPLLLRA